MLSRRHALLGLLIASTTICDVRLSFARGARPVSFAAIDRNRDGLLDLDEVKRAAGLLFDQLDAGRTGKLTRAQLGRHRITAAQFKAADSDHSGTLTKAEFLTLVEQQFRAADTDHDGTLSRAEFESRNALPLRRLIH